jgi:hypothetical protein
MKSFVLFLIPSFCIISIAVLLRDMEAFGLTYNQWYSIGANISIVWIIVISVWLFMIVWKDRKDLDY